MAGTLAIIGVYPQTVKFFPTGMAMMKNLTINMGNCNHRKYLPALIDLVESGAVNPVKILTNVRPVSNVIDAYKEFDALGGLKLSWYRKFDGGDSFRVPLKLLLK